MLTGQNGILNRSVESKELTNVAQAKEALELVCSSLMIDKYIDNGAADIKNVAEELEKQGYKVEQKSLVSGEITGVKFAEGDTISVEKEGTATANLKFITSGEQNEGYYMLINGENYEIKKDAKGNIKLADNPTNASSLQGVTDSIEIFYYDTDVIDASISDKSVTLSGIKKGVTDFKVKVNGIEYTVGNISVKELKGLASINITKMTLDGAGLITATLTDNTIATSDDVIWTSSNPQVATVSGNGIVKCGEKTGTAVITCKGTGNDTELTCNVTNSAAKIVYTNNGTSNSTINGSLANKGYNQPTIPVGFSAIDTIDAKWNKDGTAQKEYNKGLVIMDEKGNQFVWVPISADVYDEDEDEDYYERWRERCRIWRNLA